MSQQLSTNLFILALFSVVFFSVTTAEASVLAAERQSEGALEGETEGESEPVEWANCLALEGQRAYVGISRNAIDLLKAGDAVYSPGYIQIINVAVPENPQSLGEYRLTEQLSSKKDKGNITFTVKDDLAYVAWGCLECSVHNTVDGGIEIVNLGNPAAPELLGTLELYFFPMNIVLDNGFMYIGGYGSTEGIVSIQDVNNPLFPICLNGIGIGTKYSCATSMTATGPLFYVGLTNYANKQGAIYLFYLYSPDSMYGFFELGQYPPTPGNYVSIEDLGVVGERIYAAVELTDATGQLLILDSSIPPRTSLVGTYPTLSAVKAIANTYTTVCLMEESGGVSLLDVSNPANPVLRDTYDIGDSGTDVALRDGLVYALGGLTGLHIIDTHWRPLNLAVEGNGTLDPAAGYHEYMDTDVVTLTATAAAGWSFDQWLGDIEEADHQTNPVSITMANARTITAVFKENYFALKLTKEGFGYTTPAFGSYTYLHDTVVVVEAVPEMGWRFDHWEGVDAGQEAENPLSIAMTADAEIQAVFVPIEYALAIEAEAGGTTSPTPGVYSYPSGALAVVAAMPEDGWQFDHWEGDVSGDPASFLQAVTMDGSKTLHAYFVQQLYTLTLAVEGSGQITPETGVYTYEYGTQVTAAATPADGWAFDHWAFDTSAEYSAPEITLMMDQDFTVTAVFVPVAFTLTVLTEGLGNTMPEPGSHGYGWNADISITATPEDGWRFDHWAGESVEGSTDNPLSLVMNADKTVRAVFAPQLWTLTVAVEGSGACSPISGTHTFQDNESVSLAALPAEDWVFDHWTGLEGSDATANPVTIQMTSDMTVTAVFKGKSGMFSCGAGNGGAKSSFKGDLLLMAGVGILLTVCCHRKIWV